MDEPSNSLVGEKLLARIEVNRKTNRPNLPAPTFSQHFPTQVSPHYIQLDPIYYGFIEEIEMRIHKGLGLHRGQIVKADQTQ